MIVVDANVLAYLMIEGDKTALAQEVYDRDSDWLVPPILEHEFANIMTTYARRDRGEIARYRILLKQALSIVQCSPTALDMPLVVDFAVSHGLTSYDAEYAFLAQMTGLPLVTEDARVIQSVPAIAKSMKDFLAGRYRSI